MEIRFQPRDYQEFILETSVNNNTLVVLPTGTGKTAIAILTAIERLRQNKYSNILVLTPTKPLSAQIQKEFKEKTDIADEQIVLLTGEINPKKRKELWESCIVAVATPQCVTGDTQIFSVKHGPITISEFFKHLKLEKDTINNRPALSCKINEEILGYSNNEIKPVKAIKAWKSNSEEIVEIKTSLKKEIKTTPEHPLLSITPGGKIFWKQAKSFNEGDFIGIIRNMNLAEEKLNLYELCKTNKLRLKDKRKVENLIKIIKKRGIKITEFGNYRKNGSFPLKKYLELCKDCDMPLPNKLTVTNKTGTSKPLSLPKKMNSDLVYILGAILGDGHIGNRNSKHGNEVVFSDLNSPEITKIFKKKVKKVFGILPKEDKKKGLIYYSTVLATILDLLGIEKGNKTKNLRIPKFIFFENKKNISAFIGGLFNADGCASKGGIEISTANKKFAQDIQWLLKRLGLISSIFHRKQKKTKIRGKNVKGGNLYSVNFSGRSQLITFLKLCNPENNKCKILTNQLKNTKRPNTRSSDIIPIHEGLKLAYKEYRKNGGISSKNIISFYEQKLLSINSLLMVLPRLTEKSEKAKELISLTETPIRWVKIKEIKKLRKKEEVYDLTVDRYHNFITNHIISHNTIQKDLENDRISLSVTSLLVIDESHRSRENFANTKVAKVYMQQSKYPRILALTASPGGTKEKIEEIKNNLFIEEVEIRTEDDIKEYVQEKKIKWLEVELSDELKELLNLIKSSYNKKLKDLKKIGFTKPLRLVSKKDLLMLQGKFKSQLRTRNKSAFYGIYLTSLLIKMDYASELLETQGLAPLNNFWKKLKNEDTKASKTIINIPEMQKAMLLTETLSKKDIKHPKLYMLKGIIRKELEKNPRSKVIVFANYRNTIDELIYELSNLEKVNATKLIGQKLGLKQKEQIETIKKFEQGKYNVMVTSSIGEEGIDIKGANLAIMFDQGSSSEIRKIQRMGRVGRLEEGKIVSLLTRNTREMGYYWSSLKKEKVMKKTLRDMQSNKKLDEY